MFLLFIQNWCPPWCNFWMFRRWFLHHVLFSKTIESQDTTESISILKMLHQGDQVLAEPYESVRVREEQELLIYDSFITEPVSDKIHVPGYQTVLRHHFFMIEIPLQLNSAHQRKKKKKHVAWHNSHLSFLVLWILYCSNMLSLQPMKVLFSLVVFLYFSLLFNNKF